MYSETVPAFNRPVEPLQLSIQSKGTIVIPEALEIIFLIIFYHTGLFANKFINAMFIFTKHGYRFWN